MARTLFLTFITSISSICLGIQAASADDRPWSLKLFGGANLLASTDYDSDQIFPGGSVDTSFDGGLAAGAGVGYAFTDSLSLQLDYAYRSNDIERGKRNGTKIIRGGDYASVALMASGIYRFDTGTKWHPYVGVGAGALLEIDADLKLEDGSSIASLEDTAFAWQGLGGIGYRLENGLEIFSEARFLDAPDVKLSQSGRELKADNQNVSLLLGVAYHF